MLPMGLRWKVAGQLKDRGAKRCTLLCTAIPGPSAPHRHVETLENGGASPLSLASLILPGGGSSLLL